MTPIQQLMLGVGSAKKKTYLDDVFSNYLYTGTGSAKTINNGIDLSSEGGLVWTKGRYLNNHQLFDTARGTGKTLYTDGNWAEWPSSTTLTAYNNNGFTLGSYTGLNDSGKDYASWTFRKADGFFDVVKFTGDGSASRQISHSLGSVPGMVIVKNIDSGYNWTVWHKSEPTKYAKLNDSSMFNTTTDYFGNSSGPIAPTSTYFTVNGNQLQNGSGVDYIAYVFGGGESTAATATSIDLSGQEGIDVAASSALSLGTSNFCVEGWIYLDSAPGTGSPSYGRFFQLDGPTVNAAETNLQITIQPSDNSVYIQQGSSALISGTTKLLKQWNHIAVTRVSNTITVYVNGIPDGSATTNQSFNPNSGSPRVRLGYADSTSNNNGVFQGKISNIRVTIGEAVYTSAFKVPTEPLTTTSQGVTASNVKLLCCNGSSTTSSTVTPGTITAAGSPAASTDSPFDDPEGFKFGKEGDQNIIKCGKWTQGSGVFTAYLGWEPQWIMHKRSDGTGSWEIFDTMRGWGATGFKRGLKAEVSSAEDSSLTDDSTPTATGFTFDPWYSSGEEVIYIAIRRPDGYVGKPADAGTDVFNIDLDGTNNGDPSWVSGFPVDMQFLKDRAGTSFPWFLSSRLIQGKYLSTASPNTETASSVYQFDYQNGWGNYHNANGLTSWKWKRHAGLDVVAYTGNGSSDGKQVPHSLGKIPEMAWVKCRSTGYNWYVYHKGQNGGTNPHNYYLRLNHNDGEVQSVSPYEAKVWNDTAPTSTHFSVGPVSDVNGTNETYLSMLFCSVDGISKVGSYTGNGTSGSSTQTITTGFQPRFLIIKRLNQAEHWLVFDTARGWGSGDDKSLKLNASDSQGTWNVGAPTSTGFTLVGDFNTTNNSAGEYIYYAHA